MTDLVPLMKRRCEPLTPSVLLSLSYLVIARKASNIHQSRRRGIATASEGRNLNSVNAIASDCGLYLCAMGLEMILPPQAKHEKK